MSAESKLYEAFVAFGGEGRIWLRGTAHDFWALKISLDCIYLKGIGEPEGALIAPLFDEASQWGSLAQYPKALIDLGDFYGMLDWPAIKKVRAMMGWDKEGHKAAYVLRDEISASWVKPFAPSYEMTKTATFRTRDEAKIWLDTL